MPFSLFMIVSPWQRTNNNNNNDDDEYNDNDLDKKPKPFTDNKANYKIIFTINFTKKLFRQSTIYIIPFD